MNTSSVLLTPMVLTIYKYPTVLRRIKVQWQYANKVSKIVFSVGIQPLRFRYCLIRLLYADPARKICRANTYECDNNLLFAFQYLLKRMPYHTRTAERFKAVFTCSLWIRNHYCIAYHLQEHTLNNCKFWKWYYQSVQFVHTVMKTSLILATPILTYHNRCIVLIIVWILHNSVLIYL